MTARVIDMTGMRYGSAIAVEIVGPSKRSGLVWKLLCDCGSTFAAAGGEVRRGSVTCCSACAIERKRAAKTTHGLTNSPEYRNWCAMKARCLNPNVRAFANYGARGVSVCERWRDSFDAFLADMGPRPTPQHTVDRWPNNSGDYEPDNCRWATRGTQANNKRNNHLISIDGVTQTLAEWSRVAGMTESGMRRRLRRGVAGKELLAPSTLSKHTFRGETKTLAEWSQVTDIKLRTLNSRLYVYGWDLARALTTKAT